MQSYAGLNPQIAPHPRVAILQKLPRLTLSLLLFLVVCNFANFIFLSVDKTIILFSAEFASKLACRTGVVIVIIIIWGGGGVQANKGKCQASEEH